MTTQTPGTPDVASSGEQEGRPTGAPAAGAIQASIATITPKADNPSKTAPPGLSGSERASDQPPTPGDPSTAQAAGDRHTRPWHRINAALDRARAHPTGRILVRIGFGAAGGLVVLVGIILLPFPGPGWLIIFSGLAIWAVEFPWARRLLRFVRRQVSRWRSWYLSRNRTTKVTSALALVLVVLAVVALALRYGTGPDVLTSIWG